MKSEVVAAFESSLVPDAQTVKLASVAISEMSKQEGFCLTLMEIIDDATISAFVRQAALIQLKNNVERRWQPIKTQKPAKNPSVPISQPEKAQIREYLLPALVRCQGDRKFLKLYKNIVQIVTSYDYKEWLPLGDVLLGLQSSSCNLVLEFLLAVLAAFELSMNEQKVPLTKITDTVFPVLLQLAQAMLPSASQPPNQTIYLICKCYWMATHMDLSDSLKLGDLPWMTLFKGVLEYDNPDLNSKLRFKDKHSLEAYYFRSRKLVARILLKYYQKHANGKYTKSNQPYAVEWLGKYNETFLQLMFAQLQRPNLPKTQYFMMKSFSSLGYYRPQLIEKYVGPLLFQITPAFLQMQPEDEQTANDDPLELMRREDDYSLTFTNTKLAATDVWICCCDIAEPPQGGALHSTGKYILDIFKYIVMKLEGTNLIERQMAMYLLCKLRVQFNRNAAIKEHLPTVIEKSIVGELSSNILFLRARAMDIFISYGEVKFPDLAVLKRVVEVIFLAVANDKNTLVKVKAACAFNCILKHKEALQLVKPYLNKILELYLEILGRYDLEELVESLSGIVEHFSEDIGPFALQLTKHLAGLFNRYCKEDLEKIDNDNYQGELQESACGVIVAIRQIVEAKLPQPILLSLEEHVCAVVSFSLTLDGSDYLVDAMTLLNSYLFHVKALSPRIWFFYPTLIYSVMGVPDKPVAELPALVEHQAAILSNLHKVYNSENLQSITPVLCNYIYKGVPQMFKEVDYYGGNFVEILFKLVEKTYRIYTEDSAIDLVCCCHLLTFLLENVRPIGKSVLFVWQLVKFNFDHSHSKTLRIVTLQMFCIALFNGPADIVALASRDNMWNRLVGNLLKYKDCCEDDFERQRIIIGLCSYLIVANRPENAQAHLQTIFKLIVRLVLESYEERSTNDDVKTGDTEHDHHQTMPNEQNSVQSDDFYWKEEHGDCYASRLSFYDELIFFREVMRLLQQQQQETYTALMQLVEERQREPLNQAIEFARKLLLKQQEQQAALQQQQQQQQQQQSGTPV